MQLQGGKIGFWLSSLLLVLVKITETRLGLSTTMGRSSDRNGYDHKSNAGRHHLSQNKELETRASRCDSDCI